MVSLDFPGEYREKGTPRAILIIWGTVLGLSGVDMLRGKYTMMSDVFEVMARGTCEGV